MRTARKLVLVAGAALIAGGCANLPVVGGKKAPTRAAFIAESEGRCQPPKAKLREQGFVLAALPAKAQYQAYREALRGLRLAYVEIREDTSPDGDGTFVDGFAVSAIGHIDEMIEAVRADERFDNRLRDLNIKQAVANQKIAVAAGKEYGFSACLPE